MGDRAFMAFKEDVHQVLIKFSEIQTFFQTRDNKFCIDKIGTAYYYNDFSWEGYKGASELLHILAIINPNLFKIVVEKKSVEYRYESDFCMGKWDTSPWKPRLKVVATLVFNNDK